MNQYHELNSQFDKITSLNQIKQDYIRKHVLNSSSKSEGTPHSLVYSSNALFPITANSNLSRRKQLMEQNKLNDEAASSCFFFYPTRKKENKNRKSKKEGKGKVRTIKSIIKIDQGNSSNLILNSERLVQPKTPLVLPPILSRTYDLAQQFDKVTIRDRSEAILNCDKSLNQCSLNHLRKTHQFKASAFKRPMMLSITDDFLHQN